MQISKSQFFFNLFIGAINILIVELSYPFLKKYFSLPPLFDLQKYLADPLLLVVTILLLDALSYFWHRLNHRWSFLWKWHQFHHQETVIDTSTALRFHPVEVFLSMLPKIMLISFLGLPLVGVLYFSVLFQIANSFQHSNFQLPQRMNDALSLALITPAQHRLHHSIHRTHQNKNLSTIFNFWDRIFATLDLNRDDGIREMGLQ